MDKMVLIDGNSLLFRAYYATSYGQILRTKDGIPTNALLAFINMVQKVMEQEKPRYMLVAFDTGKPTFRHSQYSEYKAGRKETPEDLSLQFPLVREFLKNYGIFCYEKEGFEADDIVGTTARLGEKNNLDVHIYSGDRDLLQLISPSITVCITKKGISEIAYMTEETLMDEWGLTPKQIIDYKGLCGDSSDNIPGIKGIGDKTAVKLLQEYKDLETVLDAHHKGKLGEKIKEGRESALMSKNLATIYTELPLDYDLKDLVYNGIHYDDLKNFYVKLELKSLLSKLSNIHNNDENVKKMEVKYELKEEFSFDDVDILSSFVVELNKENAFRGEILYFAISSSKGTYLYPYAKIKNQDAFREYLKNDKYQKLGLDIKKSLNACKYHGLEVKGFTFDLLLSTYLIDSTVKEDASSVLAHYGYILPSFVEVYGVRHFDEENVKLYCAQKAIAIFESYEKAKNELLEKEVAHLYEDIEFPLTFILADMEFYGVKVDVNVLDNLFEVYDAKTKEIENEIFAIAGKTFNLNSPTQLAVFLYDELQLPHNKKRSTSVEFLEPLKVYHPVVGLILQYRKYQKLLSNYLIGLKNYMYNDGKLHSIFNQALTQTGRLSSKEPNLQNISVRDEETRLVRKAFVPGRNENYLLSLDYSQIELRILASFAGDEEMIKAFESGSDVHATTASKIFNVPLSEVTSDQRRQAKAVNFGIVYGISDWGLSEQIGVTPKEAREFIQRYFESYPKIKAYLDGLIKSCQEDGYVKTMFNRIRYVPEILEKNYNIREFGKRIAMNTPIQGSAADIIKIAMINVDRVLKENNFNTKMILQIHDELVFEVPYDELMSVIPVIQEAMENAVTLKVRLQADYEYGDSLYEC